MSGQPKTFSLFVTSAVAICCGPAIRFASTRTAPASCSARFQPRPGGQLVHSHHRKSQRLTAHGDFQAQYLSRSTGSRRARSEKNAPYPPLHRSPLNTSATGSPEPNPQPGLFNHGCICWLRFAPQQYTLSGSAAQSCLLPPSRQASHDKCGDQKQEGGGNTKHDCVTVLETGAACHPPAINLNPTVTEMVTRKEP